MPNKAGRVTETEVAKAVMRYLDTLPGREAMIDQIVKALPNYISLGSADREQSDTRPNEEIWEQQVRNIVSHKDASGNAINQGHLEARPRRLFLTDVGAAYLRTI